MSVFVKPLLLSAFGVGCLALGSGAQPPVPPQPPAVPALPGVGFSPLGFRTAQPPAAAGGFSAPGASYYTADGNLFSARSLGDDPRTRTLAKKLADAKDDDARDKLRGELKEALGKAFDDRLKGQQGQIEELEKQLKRLKEAVGKRKEAKADIVADRLAAVEKEAKGLGW